MAIRRTDQVVFRAGSLADELGRREGVRLSAGLVAKRDLERYYELVKRELPRFTRAEALAILDVCNGTLWESWSVTLLWASVSNAEGLGQKWGIDQPQLVERLRGLGYGQCVAVVDAAERFWSHAGEDGTMDKETTEAALAASGLVEATDEPA